MPEAPVFHRWQPIEAPTEPSSLGRAEMRALQKLWHTQRERIKEHGAWHEFWERMARSWSIETGVIERVFDLSLGATKILVEHGFMADLIQYGESDRSPGEVIQILEDHRASLDMVMDVVGGTRPLTVGWIKELHALICAHQETADAVTPTGQHVKIPLPRGQYKTRPNSPHRQDGSVHEYCPPEHVASEMERLVAIYNELPDLPEVRSAWLHHAFTSIHPFEDGNGRVARALASIDFIRTGMFPLLIDRSDKHTEYFPALEQADAGDLGGLVGFFYKREELLALRAISLAETVIEQTDGLSTILEAASAKIAQRKTDPTHEREIMRGRISQLANLVHTTFENTAAEVEQKVSDCRASVDRASSDTAHYFRRQIIDLAKQRGYWADLREPWEWGRLQLRDGGVTDVVVALHFIGNPSHGACVAVPFMGHRATLEGEFFAETTPLDASPFALYPTEEIAAQEKRFGRWLDEIVKTALAIWIKYL